MTRSASLLVALASVGLAVAACSTADGGATSADPSSDPSRSRVSTSPSPDPPPPTASPRDGASDRALPGFAADVSPVSPSLQRRMTSSHRAGCPVPLDDLRLLRLSYVGFDGDARTGELVVHRDVAQDVVGVFRTLYAARWPIARMQLVDEYEGDDDRSMAANNTSAYNCRPVAGSSSWSQHAYGRAIDINPVQNPYVRSGSIAPPAGSRYAGVDRSAGGDVPRGVIRAEDVVVRAFADAGWEWGGAWTSAKDYQHFSRDGR